jgi:hypothetical protein
LPHQGLAVDLDRAPMGSEVKQRVARLLEERFG